MSRRSDFDDEAARNRSLAARRRGLFVAGAVAALAGAVGGAFAAAVIPRTTIERYGYSGRAPAGVASGAGIESLLARVLPAVVSIRAVSYSTVEPFGGSRAGGGGFGPTSPFGGLFGTGPSGSFGGSGPAEQVETIDEGTGMIVSGAGDVLTNDHVVAGASQVTVSAAGFNSRFTARVVATDPGRDMALLHISPPQGLPTVSFARSSAFIQGEDVIAIGYALGLAGTPTVTSGIISAEGRTVRAATGHGTSETLLGALQTSAPINAGNSGGPLVDRRGRVVGMNTASSGRTASGEQAEDVGFAIPSGSLVAFLSTQHVHFAQSGAGRSRVAATAGST